MLVTSPDKEQFQSIVSELNSSIQGCMQGFLVGLTVKGVGYRLEPVDEKVSCCACSQAHMQVLVSLGRNVLCKPEGSSL